MEGLEAREPGGWEACRLGGKRLNSESWEPIENRFAGLESLEAREPRGLETRRPGEGAAEPIDRHLEIQEAWKLGNLEVWRLGGLGA